MKTDLKTQIPSRNYQWSWPGVGFLSFSNPIYMYVGRDAVHFLFGRIGLQDNGSVKVLYIYDYVVVILD
jgi:hypothetical protein